MPTAEKVRKLLEKSKEVFRDCLLPNGCLVAAPAQMPYYPKEAKNYFYSWPGRDVGFSLTGALLLGIDTYTENILGLELDCHPELVSGSSPEDAETSSA